MNLCISLGSFCIPLWPSILRHEYFCHRSYSCVARRRSLHTFKAGDSRQSSQLLGENPYTNKIPLHTPLPVGVSVILWRTKPGGWIPFCVRSEGATQQQTRMSSLYATRLPVATKARGNNVCPRISQIHQIDVHIYKLYLSSYTVIWISPVHSLTCVYNMSIYLIFSLVTSSHSISLPRSKKPQPITSNSHFGYLVMAIIFLCSFGGGHCYSANRKYIHYYNYDCFLSFT